MDRFQIRWVLVMFIIYSSNTLRTWNETRNSNGFITEWRSTSDFVPVQSESFGYISIGQRMSAEFDFIWGGRTNDPSDNKYEMFFRVGSDASGGNNCDGQGARYPYGQGARYPCFWLASTSDTMFVQVSDGESCQPPYSIISEYGTITAGATYHIKIAFNETKLVIDVTGGGNADWRGIQNRTATYDHYINVTVPVWWMSNKYGGTAPTSYNRGNGTFSNVVIKSDIHTLAPTAVPTTTPTTSKPTPVIPTAASPTTAQPTTFLPTTFNPTTFPTTSTPTTAQPSSSLSTTITTTFTSTANPSIMPSRNPTGNPTAAQSAVTTTTSTSTTNHYGIDVQVSFTLNSSLNLSKIEIDEIVSDTIRYFIDEQLSVIDECDNVNSYNINVTETYINNGIYIMIHAIIAVCNINTDRIIANIETSLQKDFIHKINNDTKLTASSNTIQIDVEQVILSSSISTTFIFEKDTKSDSALIIVIISLSIVLVFCVIIGITVFLKKKKPENIKQSALQSLDCVENKDIDIMDDDSNDSMYKQYETTHGAEANMIELQPNQQEAERFSVYRDVMATKRCSQQIKQNEDINSQVEPIQYVDESDDATQYL